MLPPLSNWPRNRFVVCVVQYEAVATRDHGFFYPPRPSLIVLSPRDPIDGDPIMSHAFMSNALEIVNDVYAITVEDEASGATYGFADLCALTGDAPAHNHSAPSDIAHCASRSADVFSAVNWDPAVLDAVAGAGAGVASGSTDYAQALISAAAAKNALLYGTFNATGTRGAVDPILLCDAKRRLPLSCDDVKKRLALSI
jgi:hypothetical protein